jgi:adenylyltransferase/sulfurtransferase
VIIFAQNKVDSEIPVIPPILYPDRDMKQISPADLRNWTASEKAFTLVDVREPWEHELFNIGGILLPMGDLMAGQAALQKDQPVVFYCEKGIRSVIAIQRMESLGFDNLYNLTGGMKAWRESETAIDQRSA